MQRKKSRRQERSHKKVRNRPPETIATPPTASRSARQDNLFAIPDETSFDMARMYDLSKDTHSTFRTTADFIDLTEVKGLALSKLVKRTPNSEKLGFAGKDVRTLRIVDLAYMGIQNWYIRAISAGRFVRIEFLRSMRESNFVHALLIHMRKHDETPGDRRTDLDVISAAYATRKGTPFITDVDKKAVHEELARICFEHLVQIIPESDNSKMNAQLRKLEEDNAKLQALLTKATAGDGNKRTPKKLTGLDRYIRNPSSKAEAEDVDDDDAEEDSGNPSLDAIRRPHKAKKLLSKITIKGTTTKAIEDLIKGMDVTSRVRKSCEDTCKDIQEAYQRLPVADRTGTKELAVDWGMDVVTATKLDAKNLIRICCYMAAMS